jgi:hypothetical protein
MGGESASTTIALPEETRFFVLVRSAEGGRRARLLIESLRWFGGRLRNSPVLVFTANRANVSSAFRGIDDVQLVPLAMENEFRHYFFADKVRACAQAEEMAEAEVRSLVWLSCGCLIVNPPALFDLTPSFDAALRPVHIRNVGSPSEEPLDDFWRVVFHAVGVYDVPFTVESFVNSQRLRPYFNTHCFSMNPSEGVLQAWWEYFKAMVTDQEVQSGACRDELHQVFLHQAILSALVTKLLDRDRILILPHEYSYPLHLHHETPQTRRVATLNDLACAAYEEDRDLGALEAHEPLKSWLMKRVPFGSGV